MRHLAPVADGLALAGGFSARSGPRSGPEPVRVPAPGEANLAVPAAAAEVHGLWAQINDAIGSADGSRFRRYAPYLAAELRGAEESHPARVTELSAAGARVEVADHLADRALSADLVVVIPCLGQYKARRGWRDPVSSGSTQTFGSVL